MTSPEPVVIEILNLSGTGRLVARLEPPASLVAGAVNYFTVPAGVRLAANTDYALRLDNTISVRVENFAAGSAFVGFQQWGLLRPSLRPGGLADSFAPVVVFEGFALLGNPTSPVGLSATADPMAPGEVTLGWSEPALTGQSAITKYQMRYKKTAEADSTYSAWTDVPDSDDSGSDLGDERAVTVTGLEADTPYTFQVRAVNACCMSVAASTTGTPAPHTSPVFTREFEDRLDRTLAENVAPGTELDGSPATDADGDDVKYFAGPLLNDSWGSRVLMGWRCWRRSTRSSASTALRAR